MKQPRGTGVQRLGRGREVGHLELAGAPLGGPHGDGRLGVDLGEGREVHDLERVRGQARGIQEGQDRPPEAIRFDLHSEESRTPRGRQAVERLQGPLEVKVGGLQGPGPGVARIQEAVNGPLPLAGPHLLDEARRVWHPQGPEDLLAPFAGAALFGQRQDVLGWTEGHAVPAALVEIQDPPCLGGEGGVAGEAPAPDPPGPERVGGEPAPDRRPAALRHEALGEDGPREVGP